MAQPAIEIEGLPEFRRELRKMAKGLDLQMTVIHKKAAVVVATAAKGGAPYGTKSAIRGRGTRVGAFVDVGLSPPRAIGTFMGAKKRFGWYGHPRYSASTGRQFPDWVGNQWIPGENAGKPYHIGTPINASIDTVENLMGDEIESLARRAFPDKVSGSLR